MHAPTADYSGQGFPVPPHQTVRSVFPNTAFQSSSSGGIRGPGSSGRDFVESEAFIEIRIGVCDITPFPFPVFSSEICSHPFFEVVPDVGTCSGAVLVAEVDDPSPH